MSQVNTPEQDRRLIEAGRQGPTALQREVELQVHAQKLQAEKQARKQAEKVRENRLRRAAARQGFRLVKAKRRDPRAVDYGEYTLLSADDPRPSTAAGGPYCNLDEVEAALFS